jgi:uncharacterized protein (DUF488 family)
MTGILYTLGYTHPDATTTLQTLMTSDPKMLLIDIRYSPRSRWFPQWSKKQLQASWGDRYQHMKALGNVNYHLADAPIQLLDPEMGIRWVVEQLQAGYSLILLCACREYDRCHRKVVEEQVMQVLEAITSGDDSMQ